jgi:hypothetical protein
MWCHHSEKPCGTRSPALPGRPRPGQKPHDQSENVSADVDQVARPNVLPAAHSDPTHTAAIEDQREAPFHHLGSEPKRQSRAPQKQPCSIVMDRAPRRVVAVLAAPAGWLVRFKSAHVSAFFDISDGGVPAKVIYICGALIVSGRKTVCQSCTTIAAQAGPANSMLPSAERYSPGAEIDIAAIPRSAIVTMNSS